jgi:leader peptidase (prepilin peptidase)/N-methyltransferase
MNVTAIDRAIDVPIPIACAFLGVVGAIIGSFLNVVIHRLPREQSIVFPNSTCPKCGVHISSRYPAVEALTAILFAAVTWHDGLSLALAFDLAFAASMVALVFIDAEHMILPNAITYPGIIFAIIARILVPYLAGPAHFDDLPQLLNVFPTLPVGLVSVIGAVIGALAGGGSLWLMGFMWEKLRGVEAMGFGDVKMMFMVGAFFGWRLTILTILLGALTGSFAGIVMMYRRGRNLQMMLPFGIFLGIGSIVSLLFGARIISWYASQFR